MPNGRLWHAVATIEVSGKSDGPLLLGTSGAVTIGRSERAGLHSPSPRIEMPRELARLRCTKSGWILENEGTTVGREPWPVKVTGPDIASHNGALFAPHAWVLLGTGAWTLEWDVGVVVKVSLRPLDSADQDLERAVDQPRGNDGWSTVTPEEVELTDYQRRNMAALFAYRLHGHPEPKDIYAEAARLLDPNNVRPNTRALVKSQLPKLQSRLNRLRGPANPLLTADDVGRYLVDITHTIGFEDLED
jgi:hypothetical protein